jgi:hypothetical protein
MAIGWDVGAQHEFRNLAEYFETGTGCTNWDGIKCAVIVPIDWIQAGLGFSDICRTQR